MPELFLHAAETPWIESVDAPKPVRDEDGYHEQLAGYVRKLRNITNDRGFLCDSMRMSTSICKLADNIAASRQYLMKIVDARHMRQNTAPVRGEDSDAPVADEKDYDKDYRSITLDNRRSSL